MCKEKSPAVQSQFSSPVPVQSKSSSPVPFWKSISSSAVQPIPSSAVQIQFINPADQSLLSSQVPVQQSKVHSSGPAGFVLGFFFSFATTFANLILFVLISVNLGHFFILFASHINPVIKAIFYNLSTRVLKWHSGDKSWKKIGYFYGCKANFGGILPPFLPKKKKWRGVY